jgi:hypothetical protein
MTKEQIVDEPELVTDVEVIDQLDPVDMIRNLSAMGFSEDVICAATNVDRRVVVRITKRYRPAPEDEELAEKMRHLANRAYGEAMKLLEWGPTDVKLRIISTVLGNASRLIGQAQGESTHELRAELESVYGDMRRTGTDAAATSAAPSTYDPDQATPNQALGP